MKPFFIISPALLPFFLSARKTPNLALIFIDDVGS